MKVLSKLALAGLLFANNYALAVTPADGWYAGVTGGLSFTPDISLGSLSATDQFALNNEICRLNNASATLLSQPNPYSYPNPLYNTCSHPTSNTNPLAPLVPVVPVNPVIVTPVNVIINPSNPFDPFNNNNNNYNNNNYNNNNNNNEHFDTSTAPGFIQPIMGNSQVSLNSSFGGNFAGQVGFRICNFRIEGELLFNYAPLSSLKIDGLEVRKKRGLLRAKGHTILGAALLNGYYDFYDEDNDPTWVPYLGIGIGLASISSKADITSVNPRNLCPNLFTPFACVPQSAFSLTLNSSHSSPVGQGIVGISYYTSDTFAVGLDFRHITTRSIKDLGGRYSINSFNLNLNYWFNETD
ncbi:MAG: hypothetical protein H0U57_15110 [Tatlockia sp.]|nr:hypothetical protein [Tatlockia sp.]